MEIHTRAKKKGVQKTDEKKSKQNREESKKEEKVKHKGGGVKKKQNKSIQQQNMTSEKDETHKMSKVHVGGMGDKKPESDEDYEIDETKGTLCMKPSEYG